MEQLQFPELVDIETLARLLGVGERYVRRMVSERRVPIVKVGHYVRFDLADCQGTAGTPRRRTGLLHLGGQQFSKWTDRTPPLPTTHEGVICCLTVLVGS